MKTATLISSVGLLAVSLTSSFSPVVGSHVNGLAAGHHGKLARRIELALDERTLVAREEERALRELARRNITVQGRSLASQNDATLQQRSLDKRYGGCHATFYWPETGQQGACGGFIKNSDWKVAVDADLYGNLGIRSWLCGKTIAITWGGKTAHGVSVADACPGCPSGCGLDMTPGLFDFFASQDAGVLDGMTWYVEDGSGGGGNNNPPAKPSTTWQPPATTQKPWTPTTTWTPPVNTWKSPSSTYSPPPPTSSKIQFTPSPDPKSTTTSSSYVPESSTVATSSAASSTMTASTSNGSTRSNSSSSTVASGTPSSTSATATAGASQEANGLAAAGPSNKDGQSTDGSSGFLAKANQIVLNLGDLVVEAAH